MIGQGHAIAPVAMSHCWQLCQSGETNEAQGQATTTGLQRVTDLSLPLRGWLLPACAAALLAQPVRAQDMPVQDAATAPLSAETAAIDAPDPADAPAAGAPLVRLDLASRARALDCMSVAIAYEAAGQPIAGQQAVGQVIVNRMRDPRFPKTVCGVVFQGSSRSTGCQFTFACDGSFHRAMSDTTLLMARTVAESVLGGTAPDRVSGATHYHADYVLPYWAGTGQPVTKIGAHIFYRMPGDLARLLRAGAAAPVQTRELEDREAMAALGRFAAHRRVAAVLGRRAAALPRRVAAAPQASGHAMFAPWGLSVAAEAGN